MLHSISDLTTYCRKTTGDVPAKLVGASTTVIGSKMYLFGGRLVTERRMVSDLYMFDLETFVWEKLAPAPGDDIPRARYFHSADTWNNQLIIFGGMSNKFDSPNPDELCVLNDVRFFDLATRHWLPSSSSNGVLSGPASEALVPRARYAHLSSVTADRLFIIGGQDFFNVWLDDVCIYDLLGKTWVQRRDYPRHCGTYRSVAVASNQCVRFYPDENQGSQEPSSLGIPGTRFKSDKTSPSMAEFTPSESFTHLPYSAPSTEDHPSDIYLYSNYNFTDVKRELEVFTPLPDTDFAIHDRSTAMTGSSFPPGLRFPTGAILGTHFIVAGTYLAHTYQSFSIWALDLVTMVWSRIDPGSAVATGSWFRGCLWAEASKFLIFGNRNGNLVDDYNRRLLSWDHVAIVDLEAFGIYQPPPLRLDIPMQELGLSALEEGALTDFNIVCDDGRKISCSRKILEERWDWFREQRRKFSVSAKQKMEELPASAMHIPLPDVPTVTAPGEGRLDPRLTPRAFHLSEPYPITLALLQYFYSMALLTPLQHAPAVLSQLLVLATTYRITHLEALVKHAMHRALSNSTSVGVYEVATLCSCRSLQIRALKTVMSYSQRRPTRTRNDRENGGSDRAPDAGHGRNGAGGHGNGPMTTRPRGTSDAHWQGQNGIATGNSNSGYMVRNHQARDDALWSALATVVEDAPDHPSRSPIAPSPVEPHSRSASVSSEADGELAATNELLSTAHRELRTLGSAQHTLRPPLSLVIPPASPTTSSFSDQSWEDSDRASALAPGSSYLSLHPPPRRPPLYSTASDSDTPSLMSSRSRSSLASTSRSQHSRVSLRTPVSPHAAADLASVAGAHSLASIEERRSEDHVLYGWPEHAHSTGLLAPARDDDKAASDRHLRSPHGSASPVSSFETALPISPARGGRIFSRFLGSRKDLSLEGANASAVTIDTKSLHTEEKRRRKAEAKLRVERLAQDLKARRTAQPLGADKWPAQSPMGAREPGDVAIYGGLATWTM